MTTAKMLKLLSYTKGMPYFRDRKDPATGQELFTKLITSALQEPEGLRNWWAEKDKMTSLWASWFGPMVNDPTLNFQGHINPVIKGYLNNDVNEVAYAIKYGDASIVTAWYKNVWPRGDAPLTTPPPATPSSPASSPPSTPDTTYQAVGMPGVRVDSSPTGLSRFAGFLPKVGDLGAEVYSGSLFWGALAAPLARNLASQLTVLGKNWWNQIGPKKDLGETLAEDVSGQTQDTLTAEGDPGSASNLNRALGDSDTPVVDGDGTVEAANDASRTETIAKASAKNKGTMIAEDSEAGAVDAEAAPFLEGVELAPGAIGLVGMALFVYLPIYLRGKRKHIDLRLEIVNSLPVDVAWDYDLLLQGVPMQAPPDTSIPASSYLNDASTGFQSFTPISDAREFEFANDTDGKNPLELVMNLDAGGTALVVAIRIDKKGNCQSWVGPRAGTDTDASIMERCKQATTATASLAAPIAGIHCSCNVAADSRPNAPSDPSASKTQTYSALIHLE